jgi:hypothetical protein
MVFDLQPVRKNAKVEGLGWPWIRGTCCIYNIMAIACWTDVGSGMKALSLSWRGSFLLVMVTLAVLHCNFEGFVSWSYCPYRYFCATISWYCRLERSLMCLAAILLGARLQLQMEAFPRIGEEWYLAAWCDGCIGWTTHRKLSFQPSPSSLQWICVHCSMRVIHSFNVA